MSEAERDGLECRINARLCDIQSPRQTALPACHHRVSQQNILWSDRSFRDDWTKDKGSRRRPGSDNLIVFPYFCSRVPFCKQQWRRAKGARIRAGLSARQHYIGFSVAGVRCFSWRWLISLAPAGAEASAASGGEIIATIL